MGKWLLVIAVLGTLPSLWGVVLAEENLTENEIPEPEGRVCARNSNLTSWFNKDDCPNYSGVGNGTCGPSNCKFCCDAGQNCVEESCKCSMDPGENCDRMCRNIEDYRPCCVTGVNGNGVCYCCLLNQYCDKGEGCTCNLDLCGKYCAGQEGPPTTPCCQDGKLRQCCGSNDICTDKGCSPSCKATCKGGGMGGIPCCKGEECQICDPNTHECSLTNGCQTKEVCESDQACDSWCKGQGVGGGCCSKSQRFNSSFCSCCYRGETCGPSVKPQPTTEAPDKQLQNVSLTWEEEEDDDSLFKLAFDLDADRGWGWGTTAGNGWGRCNCDKSLCEAHCGQYGSKGCCTRLPVKGDLHDFCVCCANGVNCNQDAKRCECDPTECQKQCKGTCDPSTATCKSNCASNEICKDGQCRPKCDANCISANCKSCVNDVCVASCPPEQCQGWTCIKPCNPTDCGATCDGTCDPITNKCKSGCPGTCVSGKCPCDPAKCKLQQPCGVCVGGTCQPNQCPSGTTCNPSSGNCECDKTTCQGTCAQGTTACCKNIATCACCNQWQTCGPSGRTGLWGLTRNSSWDCVCDSAKCVASECKRCDPQSQQCVSTCTGAQAYQGGKCVCQGGWGWNCEVVDKCAGVKCPNPGEKCVDGNCVCDATLCGGIDRCHACRANKCGPIDCGECAVCDLQNGCLFQCNPATQTCVNGICKDKDKCAGVTCPPGYKCVGGVCQCDPGVCGVGVGNKCQSCGPSQTCETKTCAAGLYCNGDSGDCLCTDSSCSLKCSSGQGAYCCSSDLKSCVCCPDGWNCGAGVEGGVRVYFSSGNSSSVERAGVCTDPCSGVTCPIPGDSCQNGVCKCNSTLCGMNNLCEACGSTGHCGPIECGDCATCDPTKGCQFQCDRTTQVCANGVCQCNPTTCLQTCNGQCDPQSKLCVSGCPETCVKGKCPSLCNGVDCTAGCKDSNGCCVNGNCVCCETDRFCNLATGTCDPKTPCGSETCKSGCKNDKKVSCCTGKEGKDCGCCPTGWACLNGTTCTHVKDPCPSDKSCDKLCQDSGFSNGCCPDQVDKFNSHNIGLIQWLLQLVKDLLCALNPLSVFDFLCQPDQKPNKECTCCKEDYICNRDKGGCVCDANTCTPANCKQCNPDTGNCDPIRCTQCQTCVPGKGCQSTCQAGQTCQGGTCVAADPCQGKDCGMCLVCDSTTGSCIDKCPVGQFCLLDTCLWDKTVLGLMRTTTINKCKTCYGVVGC